MAMQHPKRSQLPHARQETVNGNMAPPLRWRGAVPVWSAWLRYFPGFKSRKLYSAPGVVDLSTRDIAELRRSRDPAASVLLKALSCSATSDAPRRNVEELQRPIDG